MATSKTLGNFQGNICSLHLIKLHDYSLEPATGLKPPLQILLWGCLAGKGCSKISKTPKNFFSKIFFSNTTGQQSRISGFKKKQTSRKKVLVSVLK